MPPARIRPGPPGVVFPSVFPALIHTQNKETHHESKREPPIQRTHNPTIHPPTLGKPYKPYAPPAILHELALETRASSALSVDPVELILGIPTK
ncbi:MAG: hypothetical protein KBG20_15645 [Caldilineaceae bacterium]|nr:hypothetical protein [Caldilineaceae bacterium]MBP8110257.1 hypothetical protein [Caldilineaceae bacterium]MBP8123499.1 hypothetical protein [Caldilineaceae bacterium]MBP9073741.1 hypothetical protein [Caldilineaceae bacterium]